MDISPGRLSPTAQKNLTQWLTEPKYKEYKAELEQLIQQENWQQLEDSFYTTIPFGTGGRRGTVGVGSNRINQVTIGESAQGLADYLKQGSLPAGQAGLSADKAGVVVAYDTRLTSIELARYIASVFAANNIQTYLFDSDRPTPELSFAVRHLKASAGVVISASHNPPADNGFKAYWNDGAQVVPPHDQNIMAAVAASKEIKTTNFAAAVKAGTIKMIGAEVDDAYHAAVLAESLSSPASQRGSATIVYSPLHGTGGKSALAVLKKAGFNVTEVTEQSTPDGNFPNIPNHIANPEVPATNELATEYAQRTGADFALTTDPDADRLGVIARGKAGNYQFLTGNQIAALIGYYVLSELKKQNKLKPNDFIAKTIVTTDFLNAFAADFVVKIYDKLLIGFKYIGELIRTTEGHEQFIFGGEESHGILKGTYTRDKDAAIAALLIAELASNLKDQGKTLIDQLDALYEKYGLFTEKLHTITYPGAAGAATMQAIMAKLRTAPPQKIGDYAVVEFIDRLKGLPAETAGDVLIFSLSADRHTRVTIRPSGTEPKLKIYTQYWAPFTGTDLTSAKQQAEQAASQLQQAVLPLLK